MIEFEMKFGAEHGSIRSRLIELGAKLVKTDFNNDIYYNHPIRDFADSDEALRVRYTSSDTTITYKGPKFDQRSKSREELEIVVEGDDIKDLFNRLGFSFSGTVNKEREIWEYDNYTISLDRVEHLGEFVELELVMDETADKEEAVSQLQDLAHQLGLDPTSQIIKSYLELVLDQ